MWTRGVRRREEARVPGGEVAVAILGLEMVAETRPFVGEVPAEATREEVRLRAAAVASPIITIAVTRSGNRSA